MSAIVKERAGATPKGERGASTASGPGVSLLASKSKRSRTVTVGGPAWVDLLPPEVKARQRARAALRLVVAVVAGIVAFVALAVTLASFAAANAEDRLLDAKSTTVSLLREQTKFTGAQTVADQINAIESSRAFATSTEIDWSDYLTSIESLLPTGGFIDAAIVEAPAAWEPALAPADALRSTRVATITLTAVTPSLEGATAWVRGLRDLPGYADSTTDSLEYSETTAQFKTVVTLNINGDAHTGRFATGEGE